MFRLEGEQTYTVLTGDTGGLEVTVTLEDPLGRQTTMVGQLF